MWFNYDTCQKTKKETADPNEGGYQSCMKLWPMVKYAKICLASSHTTPTAQSAEQPSRHKQSHTVAAVFTHKRTITVTSIRLKLFVVL
jgi:hypothetical protein